jgi:hypothetical protein
MYAHRVLLKYDTGALISLLTNPMPCSWLGVNILHLNNFLKPLATSRNQQ